MTSAGSPFPIGYATASAEAAAAFVADRYGRNGWVRHAREVCYDAHRGSLIVMDDRAGQIGELYRQAFRDFGAVALWNMRPAVVPTPADALAITAALRTHGRMEGRRLAERIESLCRRADQ